MTHSTSKIFLILFSMVLIFSWVELGFADGVAVVVNPRNPIIKLTKREVSDMFLGRRHTFPDGNPVVVLERNPGSQLREKFFNLLNGMNLKLLNAYWARLQFSGRVQPPVSISNDHRLLEIILQNEAAIGYMSASSVDDSVRVVLNLDK